MASWRSPRRHRLAVSGSVHAARGRVGRGSREQCVQHGGERGELIGTGRTPDDPDGTSRCADRYPVMRRHRGRGRHDGGFPCLRCGSGTCLLRNVANALLRVALVSRGSITSSTRPRSAA